MYEDLRCALQVHFPGVCHLLRNKAGRIEFVFDPVLVEALELGLGPVSADTACTSA